MSDTTLADTSQADATASLSQEQASGGKSSEQAQEEAFDKDRALATISKLRELEKTSKAQIRELSDKVKQFQTEQMTAEQQKDARLKELEEQNSLLSSTARQAAIDVSITNEAVKLGIKPELATRLIREGDLTFGDDGKPTNTAKVLTSLLKDNPELVPRSGSANPGRGGVDVQSDEDFIRSLRTGDGGNVFGAKTAAERGGGVQWGSKPQEGW